MSSGSDNDEPSTSFASTPTKKRKLTAYSQKYKNEWQKEIKWVTKTCACDVKISHGKADLIKHGQTSKHKKAHQTSSSQKSISTMFLDQSSEKRLEDKVKEAEIRIAGFIAEHNLPFCLIDHFPDLLRSVCSDSAIAKKIKCGPTKVKSILTQITAVSERQKILNLMKTNKFSIIVDESMDHSCSKNVSLIVRVNCENISIRDYFLALIPIQEATGAAIFNQIVNYFEKYNIPYKENCIGFASDGASNMVGAQNSVSSRIIEAIPHIFVMKCICHSFHLCASYACEKLPQEVEKFTRDVYNYFSNSPKRTGELKDFQHFTNTSPLKILHPAATRWLSLESVVKRLISQYNALTLYFTDQVSQNILQAKSIYDLIQKSETKLYLEFLAYVLPYFTGLNRLMQSETPQIHILYREVTNVVKNILECFIRPEVLNNTPIYDIDFKNPRNFLCLGDMYFGAAIYSSSYNSHALDNVKKYCLQFYIEGIAQIIKRFPLKNSIFSKLEFISPSIVTKKKIKSIADVSIHFPNLIPESDIQHIDNEWRQLQNLDFNNFSLREDDSQEVSRCVMIVILLII
nr:unnamed protein product [Callosobruchus analis]